MKTYIVKKFFCKSLAHINTGTVIADSLEAARVEGEKLLHCRPNQFVGAEAIPSIKR